jgi:hypothetical protein
MWMVADLASFGKTLLLDAVHQAWIRMPPFRIGAKGTGGALAFHHRKSRYIVQRALGHGGCSFMVCLGFASMIESQHHVAGFAVVHSLRVGTLLVEGSIPHPF